MSLTISQNFIVSNSLVNTLITHSGINSEDIVFDIGAGTGILTVALAKVAKKVYAFEYDARFEATLRKNIGSFSNVEIVMGDFLKYTIPPEIKYKVFSNIPFSITSDILNKLIFETNPPTEAYIFMQKETAFRYMGKGEGTLLSLFIKPFFEMKLVYRFKRTDFKPVPSVDVVLFKITKRKESLIEDARKEQYFDFVSYALLQQKPLLKLRLNKIFTSAQFKRLAQDLRFELDAEAADLSLEQWLGLFNYYLIGVENSKKSLTLNIGQTYIQKKFNFDGPSRTKTLK